MLLATTGTILTMTSDSTIVFTEVLKLSDAQILREIRNECKDFMTKSAEYITEEQQTKWFNSLDRDSIKIYLMFESYHGAAFKILGFGYCKRDGDETYLTGGLKEDCRGKGYGKALFLHLLNSAKSFNTKITLEVLNTNVRAERLYRSIGFVPYDKDERITKMEYVE